MPASSIRCTLQLLLGFDHLARREPIFAASVLANLDQIGRRANRAHRAVELLFPGRVAMHERRHVAPRERGLAVRDRVQRHRWVGNDPLAVPARDLAVILDPFGLKPALAHALRGGTDLILRLKLDPLRFKAAMVDAGVYIEFCQPRVNMIRPPLAPLLDKLRAVPVTDLGAESILANLAHVEHDMGMGFGLASAPMSQCTFRSAIMPRSTNSDCTKSRASSMPCCRFISRGMANSTSRDSCASLRFSNASTSFQRRSRSEKRSGAPSGKRISEWMTPDLLVKSWSRSSRSSCSREAER
jgi:hypothetical protein